MHIFVKRGRESPAAMSLRRTETNFCHTELSLSDRHTVHAPPPYRTFFFKHWFMCLKKDCYTFLQLKFYSFKKLKIKTELTKFITEFFSLNILLSAQEMF